MLMPPQYVVDQSSKRERLHTMNLKVMTLNLLYADASHRADSSDAGTWEQRRGLVPNVIERHQPDVIGMQEVQDTQLHDLCELLPEYEAIPGPVNGVDRMPLWTRYGAPPLWRQWRGRGGSATMVGPDFIATRRAPHAARWRLHCLLRALFCNRKKVTPSKRADIARSSCGAGALA
jgi:hypothetical protein